MSHTVEDQAIADLINALNDRTWKTRRQASDALISLGKPAVQPLMAAIRENTFTVFTLPEAVRALGGIGDEQAVDLLIEELENWNVHAVQEAIKGLGHLGSPQAIQPLIAVFRHDWDDEETITAWQEASKALAAIGETALVPLIEGLQDRNSLVRSGVIDALGQLRGTQAVDPLVSMLQDEERQVRADAAEALGSIGDQHAVEPLVALLADEDQYVRCQACYALGDIGTLQVFDPLVTVFNDPDPHVRHAAVVNLARLQGMRIRGLDPDPEPATRHATIEQLKSTQGERVLDLLLGALRDSDGTVRSSAAHALGQIGDERVVPALAWIEQNDTGSAGANKVKDAAARAIQSIHERYQKS